jgi:hypothetical protein
MKKALLITGGLVAVYVVVRNRKLITGAVNQILDATIEKLELIEAQQRLRKSKVGREVDDFLANPDSGTVRSRP